jgi:hypothetical protein
VNRNGEVQTEEIEFDHSQKSATQVRPVELFPERDQRRLKLQEARN